MTQDEINEAEWSDHANWYLLRSIYNCEADTRVWVPKRPKWAGWTLNFAHGAAYAWLAALIAPALLVWLLTLLVVFGQ